MSNTEDSGNKREAEDTVDDTQNKKIKTETSGPTSENQFDDIFNDPIPGFGETFNNDQGNDQGQSNNLEIDFDSLPANFLDTDAISGGSTQEIPKATQSTDNLTTTNTTTTNNNTNTSNPVRPYVDIKKEQFSATKPPLHTAKTTAGPVGSGPVGSLNNNLISGLNRPTIPSSISSLNSISSQPYSVTTLPYNDPRGGQGPAQDSAKYDSSKLNDAIAAAGVNLQQEEDILIQQQLNRRSDLSSDMRNALRTAKPPAFLNAYHVAAFMNKIAKENGVQQNFLQDGELLELMSASCESWISNILTKTIILSRHRRRGIPVLTNKNNKKGAPTASSGSRSELSKELRNLAARQKELEEKRVSKRILLGLEKNASDAAEAASGADSKAGAEETLHRAANATAAMMTMNPGRKKYSWMTSNAGAGEAGKGPADKDGKSKQSSIISVRGDNGLRFREIRSGNSVTMKDLLGAIEDERMGTEKALIKGFAKLKD